MPDPISPLGSPGQPQPLAPTPNLSPLQATPDAPGGAKSAQPQAAEGVQVEGAVARAADAKKSAPHAPSLEEATKEVQDYLKNLPADLQFRKDDASGTVVFKIVNPVTKEVIRQYPPEELLQVARRLRQLSKQGDQSGILLDRKF